MKGEQKKDRRLLISTKRKWNTYYVNSNKSYKRLLDEIRVKLIALDVLECEEQDLIVTFDTKHANRLIEDLKPMQEIIRYTIDDE